MRTRAFELPNPISDYQCRRNTDDNVDMRLGTADFMKDDSLGLERVPTNVLMQARFDFGADSRQTFFHVPGEMQVDFGIHVSSHGSFKPRSRGFREALLDRRFSAGSRGTKKTAARFSALTIRSL